jgi:cytochrome c biogenesis protein CcmG, thiol:disulfide interchange protein DsbE
MKDTNDKNESSVSAIKPPQNWKRTALEWLGFAAVAAAFLFFFAPESWWQFGVSPAAERKLSQNFTLQVLGGGEWSFDDHRGKVVVVNYWATWCGPCRIETPGLVSFANEHAGKNVEVVGVTVDEDLSLVPPFVDSYKIGYPILTVGFDPNLSRDGIVLPTTLLYDKNGNLAKKYTGIVLESTLRSDTAILLSEKLIPPG